MIRALALLLLCLPGRTITQQLVACDQAPRIRAAVTLHALDRACTIAQ